MMISSTAMELEENRTDPSATLVTKRTIENNEDSDSFMGSSMDVRKMMAMVGVFYWSIMTVIVVPTACIATCWIFLCPIMLFSMPLFNRLEHELCRLVNDHWVSNGQYVGLNVVEYGDDIEKYADKRCLLLSNHLGLVDHFCIMTSVHNKKSLAGKYLWVIFQIWKATPLGAMWMTHGNYFINGGARKRASAIQSFREHLENKYWKHDYGWIVMYPEGSRLYLIRDAEVKFAEKNGFKPFVHCAHPRTGAAHAVLDVAGKDAKDNSLSRSGNPGPIEYIIDCTLGYPKGKVADMGQIMLGEWPDEDSTVAVHYRVYEAKPEFADEPTLRKWLYERYEEKDKLLAKFYETGKFPGEGRPVHFSLAKNLMVQVFWIALFYFHYNFWIRPLAGAALRYLLALF